MRSHTVLLTLVSVASITGAVLYGRLVKISQGGDNLDVDTRNKIANLELKVEQLQGENISLRQLANTPGDVIVDIEWIKFIEQETGLTFKEHPQIIRENADGIIKFAANEWLAHYGKKGLLYRDFLFNIIGLTPETEMEYQLALLASGFGYARAVYDYEGERIVVSSDFDIKNISDMKLLTAALSMALLEQNFPIETPLSDDAFLARRMVVHGNAAITSQAFNLVMQQKFNLTGATIKPAITQEQIREQREMAKSMPQHLKNMVFSPTIFGRQFVEAQYTKDNTRKESIQLAMKKANSTLSVIQLAETPVHKVSGSEDAEFSGSIGALGIYSHASRGAVIEQPIEVAKDYVSDLIETFTESVNDQDALRISWTIQFSSQKSAEAFERHLKDIGENLTVKRFAGMLQVSAYKIFSPQ